MKGELSKTLDRNSMSGRHIWSHVEWEVRENCFVGEDEKVYARERWGSPQIATGLYVHPITGLLCWRPRKRLKRPILEEPLDLIQIDENNALSRVDGIWYHLGPARQNDPGTELVRPKRQLSRKDLARHGLANSAAGGEKPDKQETLGALAGGRPRVRRRP